MQYSEDKVMEAFKLYTRLAARGQLDRLEAGDYFDDDDVRNLLDRYVDAVQCVILPDADKLYLVPLATESEFHISNDAFKKQYLPARAVNMDIYLLYMAIIVLFGCFYDSYQTNEAVEFVTMSRWLESMDDRMEAMKNHDEDFLRGMEKEFEFNWVTIRDKWLDMDSLKENVKNQDARNMSRVGFLNQARNFLLQQGLLENVGNMEMCLTEKAKNIYVSYYMDSEYNRGLLDFMYSCDHKAASADTNGKAHGDGENAVMEQMEQAATGQRGDEA